MQIFLSLSNCIKSSSTQVIFSNQKATEIFAEVALFSMKMNLISNAKMSSDSVEPVQRSKCFYLYPMRGSLYCFRVMLFSPTGEQRNSKQYKRLKKNEESRDLT